jgi:hypothetical protein
MFRAYMFTLTREGVIYVTTARDSAGVVEGFTGVGNAGHYSPTTAITDFGT